MKKFTIKTDTKVVPTELSRIIKKLAEMQQDGKNPPPCMVWGAPGVGKSDIVRQVAGEMGIEIIDVRLPQREPVDMRGLPVPNMKEKSVDWFTSSEWPREADSKGIIFFDELTAADRMNQAAAYEFILDRRLGKNYAVPQGWYICAAGNRISDHAVATQMSSALANRFIHFNLEADAASWCEWAETRGILPAIIAFVRFKPELLHAMPDDDGCQQGWPSPRSWERVDTLLKAFPDDDHHKLVAGLIGEATAVQFMAFMKSSYRFDTDVYKAMTNHTVHLPDKNDQLYAWCVSAANLLLGNQADFGKLVEGFCRILLIVPPDFAQMMLQTVRGSLTHDNLMVLLSNDDFQKWGKENGGR